MGLNHQYLEHHHRVVWRPPTIRAVGIGQRHIQLRPEHLEINRASIGIKLIAEIAQTLQSFIDIEKSWLAPLPIEDVLREASATGRVLVVDEKRRTGGVSEGILAELVDAGFDGRFARVTSKDSFVPLGDAARLVLVSEDEIEAAALAVTSA